VVSWSNAVSVVAFVVAALSAVFAYRADRRAGRAEARADRMERRELEARLVIEANGASSEGGDRRYAFKIRNHGGARAHGIRVWLVDRDGEDVSTKPQAPFTLAPDEASEIYGVTAPAVFDPRSLRFAYSLSDAAGENRATITDVRASA
jgi:hypothetical protein